jgi:S-adenosylmethionine:tRNA ribosyltransferase-isomerase
VDDLDFDLPEAYIAQVPSAHRDQARLLVVPPAPGPFGHQSVADLPALLRAGDLLVLNDTRVLATRCQAHRETGGRVHLVFVEGVAPLRWRAFLKAGGRPQVGERLRSASGARLRLAARDEDGTWLVDFEDTAPEALFEAEGRMPLPPYISRDEDDERDAMDRERYQTVFAGAPGAVAAPTAGLHFTDELFARLAAAGIARATLTLHVGLGTFAPVRTERLEDHAMHRESYVVPQATVDAIRACRAQGGRVVCVGTTAVRALEAAAAGRADGLPAAGAGSTDLLIAPGHGFRVVDLLVTNFHRPRSTLMALVAALVGLERIHAAYEEAKQQGYRFHSYGDAMLLATSRGA